jgi:Domain of Unknown Function (DUF1080)
MASSIAIALTVDNQIIEESKPLEENAMNSICAMLMMVAAVGGDDKKATVWDFENGTVGKLPPHWTAAKTGNAEGSAWKVAEDKTAPKGPKVLAQTAKGPASLFNLCVADASKFADVDLSVSFKAIAGDKDQGGGPVWRFQDADNYYVCRMNPLEDNFRVYKVVAGKRMQLATADVNGADNVWHTIRVVQVGEHIQCWFNGKMLLDVKDGEFKEAGKVGLWTKADAQTYFDNLVVSAPKK